VRCGLCHGVANSFAFALFRISYKEFVTAFRSKTNQVADQLAHMDSTVSVAGQNLVGLDAKIPGGRYDPDLNPELKVEV